MAKSKAEMVRAEESERVIETLYYKEKDSQYPCKVNKSKHVRRAIMNALDKLDNGYEDAWLAVIWNTVTYELYRIIVRHADGNIETMYYGDKKMPLCLTNIDRKLLVDENHVVHKEPKKEPPVS